MLKTTHTEFIKKSNNKVGDHVKTSKCKNIFTKGYNPNWSYKVFVIKKVKILFDGHMLLMILMVKILLERFVKKSYKKQIKKNLE